MAEFDDDDYITFWSHPKHVFTRRATAVRDIWPCNTNALYDCHADLQPLKQNAASSAVTEANSAQSAQRNFHSK